MTQFYTDPTRENDPHALPDAEAFHVAKGDDAIKFARDVFDEPNDGLDEYAGWWWWSCQPGCLPYSEPDGPFDTEAAAIGHARRVSA
jgi:hypothetical protein